MNLDDLDMFGELDGDGMLAKIDGLPDQLQKAWDLGVGLEPPDAKQIGRIVIAGMGGSAIGADLLTAYVAPTCPVPVVVWRDYDLPAYALEPGTLLVASSHSGNTEETLSAYVRALEAGLPTLAVTTGGELGRLAEENSQAHWRFEHGGPPRAAVGFSFGLLLALLHRLELVPDPSDELSGAVEAMRTQMEALGAASPVVRNPAKRMAGQFMERWPTILAAGFLAPVARRWRTQIAELAKAVAQFEILPEADHNMLAGSENPEALFGRTMVVFLRGGAEDPRNLIRIDMTRESMMVQGFNTDVIEAEGESRLAQQWTSLHYGDYVGFYLAMAYGVDPTPVDALEDFKLRMRDAGGSA